MLPEILTVIAIIAAVLLVLRLVVGLLLRAAFGVADWGLPHAQRLHGRWRDWKTVAAVRARWPGPYRFFADRFAPSRFDGLPLTLLAAALLYFGFLFAGIVEEVFESEEIQAADEAIFAAVDGLRTEAAIDIFIWITHFGDFETLVALTLLATAMLAVHGPQRFILPLWIATLGAQLTTWSGKYIIARQRPEFTVDLTENTPSFPSGHATGAVAVYLLVAYILARDLDQPRQRFEIAFWLSSIALLVAFSRIFLGVHYPSDVAAGILVGAFWTLVAVAVAELIKQQTLAAGR